MEAGPEAAVAVLVEWEGVTAEQYDEMINRMSVADRGGACLASSSTPRRPP